MTYRTFVSLGFAVVFGVRPAVGQHEQHQGAPGAGPPAAQVTQCAQAQPVIRGLLEASLKRLEDARLTNDPAAMRDAADDLQSALIDIRAQLAPCAMLQATTDAHAHVTPNVPQAPAASPGTSAMQPGSPEPAPGAVKPSVPAPPAVDPHAGHATPPAPVAPRAASPARPPATHQHPGASDSDTRGQHAAVPGDTRPAPRDATAPGPPTNVADLKCPTAVDPKTAPRMLYQGRMYYFCTEATRAEFAKDPGKFVTAPAQAPPAHAH